MFLLDKNNFNNKAVMQGIGYCKDAIINSSTGFSQFLESGGKASDIIEGKYLIKYPFSEDSAIVETDDMGAELLFLYRHGDYWCLSTSLYQLALYIKNKKMPLTLKETDLALNFVQTSLFEQPINNNPVFEEVLLISSDDCVYIDRNYIEIKKKNKSENFYDIYHALPFFKKASYFICFYRDLVLEISKKYHVNLELSGGIDSRVLFAIFRDEVISNKIRVSTDKNRKNDYLIVQMLSKLYNFSLIPYKDNNIGKKDISTKYQLFKYGNIGISRTHKRPNSGSGIFPSLTFRVNGGGGGIGKLFYNENYMAYVNLIQKSKLNDVLKGKVINKFIKVLHKENYQDHPTGAMVELYSKYRMRYFAGRSWYYSLLGIIISPFNSRMFQSMILSKDLESFFKRDLEYIYKKNLIQLYLLYMLAPELVFITTDSVDKNFDIEDINLVKNLFENSDVVNEKESFEFVIYNARNQMESQSEINYSEPKNYDDLIYEDINKGFSLLERSGILTVDYLLELRRKIENKTLTRIEEGCLLHVTSLLLLAD